ncbi:homoserine kinase [Striga asiatica]|uniref:Homoserine kinase n=1 Tax=Striga asiatica TaxID=4170 RepID=A0A5A7QSS3_STRAF|nr:homoserine kinase [Striga asiatica]
MKPGHVSLSRLRTHSSSENPNPTSSYPSVTRSTIINVSIVDPTRLIPGGERSPPSTAGGQLPPPPLSEVRRSELYEISSDLSGRSCSVTPALAGGVSTSTVDISGDGGFDRADCLPRRPRDLTYFLLALFHLSGSASPEEDPPPDAGFGAIGRNLSIIRLMTELLSGDLSIDVQI